MRVNPQLPNDWNEAQAVRSFREADFHIDIIRSPDVSETTVFQGEKLIKGNLITDFSKGETLRILVKIPA